MSGRTGKETLHSNTKKSRTCNRLVIGEIVEISHRTQNKKRLS